MMNRIGEKFAVADTLQPPKTRQPKPADPKPSEKVEEKKPEEAAKVETELEDELTELEKTDETKTETKPEVKADAKPEGKKEKVNPWKRGDEFKALYEKSEAEVLRLKKLLPNESELTAQAEKFKQLEEQNKELLQHIRYTDYQKHPEFQEKYEQPYQDAWNRLMRRLAGVGVAEANGTKRAVQPADILKLSSLPADQAIEQAKEKFGDLGFYVAERVEELKQLWENKAEALEKAKKDGVDFFQKQQESAVTQQKEITDFLGQTWTKAVEDIKTHSKFGKYFNQVEGDDEYNASLEKAVKLVDKALTDDPRDPKLSPEDRATIVKRHAAMRNRAIAFSTMNLTIQRLEAQLAEANEKLKQFTSSVPKTDGSDPGATTNAPADPWSNFGNRLAQYAK